MREPACWFRPGLLVLALVGVPATLWAQTASPPTDTQRSLLRTQREQQTAAFDAQARACLARFFTTACLDDVARAKRAMLTDIQRKEAALDTADRTQRGQDALQRLKEKQAEHADTLRDSAAKASPQPPGDAAASARAPLTAANPQSKASRASKVPSGPSAQARASNQAAFDAKQLEAKRRLAERARAAVAASAASAPRSLPPPTVPVQ